MTLRELASIGDLRLTVLTGAEHLERSIEWVHPTDMLDPSAYLASGELVLTNGLWRERPRDSETFVSHLVHAGVHGLVFAVYPGQQTPPDLVRACTAASLPLMELKDLPFRAVSEAVIDRMIRDREQAQSRARRFEAALTKAVADGEGVAGITRRLESEIVAPCLVIGRDGGALAGAQPEPVWPTWLDAVSVSRRRAPGQSGIRLGKRTLFVIQSGGLGRKIPDAYLVIARLRADLRGDERRLISIAVDHLRLEFSRLRAIRITERRYARELVELFRAGAVSAGERDAHLRSLGLDSGEPVVALEAYGDSQHIDETLVLLEAVLARMQAECTIGSAIVVSSGAVATAITAAPVEQMRDRLRDLVGTLADALDVRGLAIGVSDPCPPDELSAALADCRHARLIAQRREERPAIAGRHDAGSYEHLLGLAALDARRAHRSHVLGPLLEHDAAHGSELAHTLDAFLRQCGVLERAARELHVHVNTLRYRLAKIETLTGRDLSSMAARVDFFLALESGAD